MELNLLKMTTAKKTIPGSRSLEQFFYGGSKDSKSPEKIMDRLRAECRHIQEQRNAEAASATVVS